jgi:signal transduction histidine kinase
MVRMLPIRVRLTLLFAVGSAIVLAGVGAFVYARMGADLLVGVDASLSAQAGAFATAVRQANGPVGLDRGIFVGSDEEFVQIADASGRVIESTKGVASVAALPPGVIRSVAGRTFLDTRVPGIENVSRLVVQPLDDEGRRVFLVVGMSLQDRADALVQLAVLLGIGGPVALALMSFGAWALAGAALRPVERMRQEAEAISRLEPERRLSVPDQDDEISRLGATLNAMLDRIDQSFEAERRFLDDASHELRTPLSVLKAELDLAVMRERTPEELRATVEHAAVETDRVVRLAEDLLVLSRAHRGRLQIHRADASIGDLVREACDRHRARAMAAGVRIEATAGGGLGSVDPLRVRQALDNLLDNALRHTPPGGVVSVAAATQDGAITFVVDDSGPGFPPELLDRVFVPFSRGASADREASGGAGLGLAIVQAIAAGHGGTVSATNRSEGGARVTLSLRDG